MNCRCHCGSHSGQFCLTLHNYNKGKITFSLHWITNLLPNPLLASPSQTPFSPSFRVNGCEGGAKSHHLASTSPPFSPPPPPQSPPQPAQQPGRLLSYLLIGSELAVVNFQGCRFVFTSFDCLCLPAAANEVVAGTCCLCSCN